MNFDIQIYSDFENSSLNYVLDFLFEDYLGLNYQLISQIDSISNELPLINYSRSDLEGVRVLPSYYLKEESFFKLPVDSSHDWNEMPIVFETGGDIPFDLFSAIFFFLSRAEEYNSAETDEHGRFLAQKSWAYRNKVLERPIVDEWIESFKSLLEEKFAEIKFKKHSYQWINTYDIDIAYAHLYRPFKRLVGGAIKSGMSGDIESVQQRLKVLAGSENDPFDTYDYQREVSHSKSSKNIYFFPVGAKSKFDNALALNHPGMIRLIRDLQASCEIGLHPSYKSPDSQTILEEELSTLEKVIDEKVSSSRQHFLRLKLPDTYRNLINCQIENDYSMGFPHHVGFRSGTTRGHKFFDLKANRVTDLNIYPLQIMDGTLIDYMQLSPEKAVDKVADIVERTKKVKGNLVTLWHNHILEEGSPWRKVYKKLSELASVR